MVTDPVRTFHPPLAAVTRRIASAAPRCAAPTCSGWTALAARPRGSDRMGCANVAHAFAALPAPTSCAWWPNARRTWAW
jgi:phosphogluconate dehydratase